MPAAVSIYERILQCYPDAEPEDYIFYPEYKNRTTASGMIQRLFTEVLRYGELQIDTPGKTHSIPCVIRQFA